MGLDLRSDHSLLLGHRALMLKATMPCTTPPGLGRHLHWDWLGPSYRGGRTPSVHRAWKVREAALSAQTIRDLLRHAEEVQPDSGSQCVSKFFFLHKPLLTSNFFFPLQSLGEPIPQENAVCPGASWTARHALPFSWVPASQSFEMITRATRVSVAAAKIQVLGSRKISLRAEIIKTAAVRSCRQQNPSRGPAGTQAGEALSTYGGS